MNICLLNNVFPPINTGSSHYTLELAKNLSKLGHNVIVITSKINNGCPFQELHEYGFKIYRLKKLTLPKLNIWMNFPDFYITLFLSNYKLLKRIILENKIEILHQCNNIFDLVFMSALLSKKLKLPLICSLTTQIQHSNNIINWFLEKFDKIVIKNLFSKHVYKYIALDREAERYIKERYDIEKNVVIIPFGGTTINNFTTITHDFNKINYSFVSIGHLSELKDRKELFEAIRILKERGINIYFTIIGDIFSKKIKKFVDNLGIEKNIKFTGRIAHKDIPGLLKDFDFGTVMLSNIPYHRGIGIANLELMASSLPVLLDADDCFFGEKFPVFANEHFVRVESRSPYWLANKIIEIINDPDLRKRIGEGGKKFVLSNLTWEKIIYEILDVYQQAILNN